MGLYSSLLERRKLTNVNALGRMMLTSTPSTVVILLINLAVQFTTALHIGFERATPGLNSGLHSPRQLGAPSCAGNSISCSLSGIFDLCAPDSLCCCEPGGLLGLSPQCKCIPTTPTSTAPPMPTSTSPSGSSPTSVPRPTSKPTSKTSTTTMQPTSKPTSKPPSTPTPTPTSKPPSTPTTTPTSKPSSTPSSTSTSPPSSIPTSAPPTPTGLLSSSQSSTPNSSSSVVPSSSIPSITSTTEPVSTTPISRPISSASSPSLSASIPSESSPLLPSNPPATGLPPSSVQPSSVPPPSNPPAPIVPNPSPSPSVAPPIPSVSNVPALNLPLTSVPSAPSGSFSNQPTITTPLSSSSTTPASTSTSGGANPAITLSLTNTIPPIPSGFKDTFIGVDKFTFSPPGAWETSNSTACNQLTKGSPGRGTNQNGASFSFNVTSGGVSNIFLTVTGNSIGGNMSVQVNGGVEQFIDLRSSSTSCEVAPLNLGTSPKLSTSIRSVNILLGSSDGNLGETLVTAKILNNPAEVDGATIRQQISGANGLTASLFVCLLAVVQSLMLFL